MGVKKRPKPPLPQGFGGRATDPTTKLAEAAKLASDHQLLGAQQLLDAIEPALGHTPRFQLLQGFVAFQLGDLDRAVQLLRPLAESRQDLAMAACSFLADALHHAADNSALAELLEQQQAWAVSAEGRLFAARLVAQTDPEAAVAALLPLAEGRYSNQLRRMAGFDAVKLLDRLGRYQEAWPLAQRLQAATAPPFDLRRFLARFELQLEGLRAGRFPVVPAASPGSEPQQGLVFILGMPRSGTTLLEQMLDAHPAVRGIGEFQGVNGIARALVSQGVWPDQLERLSAPRLAALQQGYLQAAQRLAGAPTPWIIDKSLLAWQWLPAIAKVLPASLHLHLRRDPRDLAISLSMAAIRPSESEGWVSSLEGIREVIRLHRQLVPLALERLGLNHRIVDYEALVREPEATIQTCLDALKLPMDPAVLQPEANPRTPITLSHAQVRQPISTGSIGRWRNYEWLFDGSWDSSASS
jgi:hypothetical protein